MLFLTTWDQKMFHFFPKSSQYQCFEKLLQKLSVMS